MKIMPTLGSVMSGSLSGLTAGRGRGGTFLRARSVAPQPNTPAQQSIRNAVRAVSAAWSNVLTNSQRAGWNLYGQTNPTRNNLGTTVILSGFQVFCRINLPLYFISAAPTLIVNSPGAVPFLNSCSWLTSQPIAHAGSFGLYWNCPTFFANGDILFMYITRPVPPGRVPTHNVMKLLSSVTTTGVPGSRNFYEFGATNPFAGAVTGGAFKVRTFMIRGNNLSAPVEQTGTFN